MSEKIKVSYTEFKRLVAQEVRLKDRIAELEDESEKELNLTVSEEEIGRVKLAEIANYLNKRLSYSDIKASIEFQKYGGALAVNFTHFDDRYKSDVHTVFIHSFGSHYDANKKLKAIKDVLAGEALFDD